MPPKVEIYREVCIACGACDQSCPTDVLRLGNDSKPYVAYPDDCQGCFLCEFDCPVGAIRVVISKWYPVTSDAQGA